MRACVCVKKRVGSRPGALYCCLPLLTHTQAPPTCPACARLRSKPQLPLKRPPPSPRVLACAGGPATAHDACADSAMEAELDLPPIPISHLPRVRSPAQAGPPRPTTRAWTMRWRPTSIAQRCSRRCTPTPRASCLGRGRIALLRCTTPRLILTSWWR